GYQPVFDYKIDQLGIKASYNGFVQIEGAWYCPAISQPLIDATLEYRKGLIDEPTYRARLVERRNYLARFKGVPGEDGHYRLMCPAASNWLMARCDNKPVSISSKTSGKLRIRLTSRLTDNPPSCCTQQSVTMPPEAGAKFAQQLLYESEEWNAVYHGLRNTNEGMHGFAKDGAYEALDDPRRRRLLGMASQSVLVALTLFAANVRKISGFLEEQARIEQARIPGPRKKPARRRTRGLETWAPKSGQGPPDDPAPPLIA
ncbi:MAG: hypothetical protein KGJ77_10215, partial [Acidobacteriota bacterium]|nr:hypothetical protein [Acidobacteriota bacterium]